MSDKTRKLLQSGVALMSLSSLLFFFYAYISGWHQKWVIFGMCLAVSITLVIVVASVNIRLDIDRRFKQLEKHIDELKTKKPKDEQKQ